MKRSPGFCLWLIVDGGEQIAAFIDQSDRVRVSLGRKPSPRYIGLLIEGVLP